MDPCKEKSFSLVKLKPQVVNQAWKNTFLVNRTSQSLTLLPLGFSCLLVTLDTDSLRGPLFFPGAEPLSPG